MFRNGRYVGPMWNTEDPPGGGGTGTQDQSAPKPLREQLTPEQIKELDSQIAAARRQAEADAKAKIEADLEQARKEAEAEAERKRLAAAGEFDKVRQTLEEERDAAKEELKLVKAREQRATELLKTVVEPKVKLLGERDEELAKAFPTDADILDQIAWLDDPRTKRVLDAEPASPTFRPPAPRVPAAPTTEAEAEKQRQAELAQSGVYGL